MKQFLHAFSKFGNREICQISSCSEFRVLWCFHFLSRFQANFGLKRKFKNAQFYQMLQPFAHEWLGIFISQEVFTTSFTRQRQVYRVIEVLFLLRQVAQECFPFNCTAWVLARRVDMVSDSSKVGFDRLRDSIGNRREVFCSDVLSSLFIELLSEN